MLSWFNRPKHPPASASTDKDREKEPPPSTAPPEPETAPAPKEPTDPYVAAPIESRAPAPVPVPALREDVRTPSPIPPTTPTTPIPEQPKKRAFTAALSTPHDAVLAELQDHHPGHDPSARIDAAPLLSTDTLPAASPPAPDASAKTAPLYDPFTGAQMGVIAPARTSAQAQEELWAHLGRVRELQAAIAGMHVTMEGIGLGEQAVRGARVRARSGAGERLDERRVDEEDAEGEDRRREERENQFKQSEARFGGRKEEIEAIMGKLGELSQALATFHALDTPIVNFEEASRNNTAMSSAPGPQLSRTASRVKRPDVRRLASDASDFFLESPASMQMQLPIVEEPEGGAAPFTS